MGDDIKERTLGELAEHVGGYVCGDPNVRVRAAATLAEAGPGEISFLANRKYDKQVRSTRAGAVIVGQEMPEVEIPQIVAEDAYYAFSQVLVLLYGHRRHRKVGVSAKASIAATATLGSDCHIHDFVTVADGARIGDGCVIYPSAYIGENVRLGDGCIVYPNVVIYDGCTIGSRVIINANSTIGGDGYGYATHEGVHHKIPQVGIAIIEDDVEIGCSCSVERGTLGNTVVGRGSKLGDMVALGHGSQVGPYCLLVAQVGIAGSTTLGHHCVMGGQVGVVGHITIGNGVTVAAQAGVINSVSDGEVIAGAPAIDLTQARRAYAMLPYLPRMRQDIRDLQKRLRRIADALDDTSDEPADSRDERDPS